MEIGNGTRVRATQAVGDIEAGDTGAVVAAWKRAMVYVRWDKDSVGRRVNRKRLEAE